jgi:hypothetical protein
MTIKITEGDLQASQQPQSSPPLSKITVGNEVWSVQPHPVRKTETLDTISTKPEKEMWILGGIVGGTLLLIVCFGIVLTIVNSSTQNHEDAVITITKVNNTVHQIVAKIEKLDTLNSNEKFKQMVHEFRHVNLSDCPQDFKMAFLEMIHCFENLITFWEEYEEFIKKVEIKYSRLKNEAEAFNDSANSIETFLELFVRGALGDPFGKAQEIMYDEKVLKSKFQNLDIATQNEIEAFTKRGKKIENNIQEAIHQLEWIAAQYNAKFN